MPLKRNLDNKKSRDFWNFVDENCYEMSYWPEADADERRHIADRDLENWFWNKIQSKKYSEILKKLEKYKHSEEYLKLLYTYHKE
ncbi:MAG: hypothetical protein R3321_05190 [Nitrososphaeraceae archaeon]|nr:hypothetical protein [Nitrososphaeraceae archaeon]